MFDESDEGWKRSESARNTNENDFAYFDGAVIETSIDMKTGNIDWHL